MPKVFAILKARGSDGKKIIGTEQKAKSRFKLDILFICQPSPDSPVVLINREKVQKIQKKSVIKESATSLKKPNNAGKQL